MTKEKVKFEKGKYYRRECLFTQREGEYYKVLDITHPDKTAPEHTLHIMMSIRYHKFDPIPTGDWKDKRFLYGPSQHFNVHLTSTLEDGEGYVEVPKEEWDNLCKEVVAQLMSIDEHEGSFLKFNAWWGEVHYAKVFNTEPFKCFIPRKQEFVDAKEQFHISFNEWRTAQCGFSLRRGYESLVSEEGEKALQYYNPIDGSELLSRREALIRLLYEDAQGFYDFVPDPYKQEQVNGN